MIPTPVRTVALTSTVLLALFAGTLFCASIAITPSLALLDAANFTAVKQEQIKVLQIAMSAISILYSLGAIYVAVWAKKNGYNNVYKLTVIGLILVIAALALSAFTDIPYNGVMLKWSAANPPANWSEVRDNWDLANRLRTIPTVLAVFFQSAALIALGKGKES
jgi:hypothetical protein